MSDLNYMHEFNPNREGKCKTHVGGRKNSRICHLKEDAEVHTRWVKAESAEEEPEKKVIVSVVESRHWGPDDDYNVVPEFQVFERDFPLGSKVRITVERITDEEFKAHFKWRK